MLLLLLPPEPLLPLQPFNQTPCYVASKKKIQPHIHLEIAYITKWMKKRKIGIGKKQANISNADGKVFQWVFSSSNRHLALIFCMLQKCDLDGFFFSHLSFEITNLLLFVVFFLLFWCHFYFIFSFKKKKTFELLLLFRCSTNSWI